MGKISPVNDLLKRSTRLAGLRRELGARERVKDVVCAALAPPLGGAIVSAGLAQGELVLGVAGAGWASRLRYLTETLRTEVSRALGVPIARVKIRVVPPRSEAGSGI